MMPKKPTVPPPPQLERIKKEASIDIVPIAKANSLMVTDATSFARADAILAQLDARCNHYESLFSEILDPLNAARTATLKAKKEVLDPWTHAVDYIRLQMKQFKNEEARLIQQEKDRVETEQRQLLEEAQRKDRQAEAAKNPKVQERLAQAARALTEQAQEVTAVPVIAPVAVIGSTTRTVKAWRLVDLEDLIEAVSKGIVGREALKVDEDWARQMLRANPAALAKVPGIEVYDDVQIVRR